MFRMKFNLTVFLLFLFMWCLGHFILVCFSPFKLGKSDTMMMMMMTKKMHTSHTENGTKYWEDAMKWFYPPNSESIKEDDGIAEGVDPFQTYCQKILSSSSRGQREGSTIPMDSSYQDSDDTGDDTGDDNRGGDSRGDHTDSNEHGIHVNIQNGLSNSDPIADMDGPALHEPFTFDPRNPNYLNTPIHKNRPLFEYRLQNMTKALLEPQVSVVIPFHNTGSVFFGTLSSVLKQSLQQFEIIIVNDGTTLQSSLNILNEFRSKETTPDVRIKVIDHSRNMGPGAARNTGYRNARTDFVFFLDSDDFIEPTTLEKLYWHLISNPKSGFAKGYCIGFGAFTYLWQRGFDARESFLKENLVTVTAMFRKSVLEVMGGFDVDIVDGLEDWDFWLKSAESGIWGTTIREYMDWYRRKTPEEAKIKWNNWEKTSNDFKFASKYPKIHSGQFPTTTEPLKSFDVKLNLPLENKLVKKKPRLMMIIPWLVMGGADRFNINLLRQLYLRQWELTIVTTLDSENNWWPDFAKYTPDVWMLPNYVKLTDFPRMILYLIKSRQPDIVMISNSEIGYQFLPYLRSQCPEVTFVDFNHMEEVDWKNGGYPRYGYTSRDMLDLNLVASQYLKGWMVERGAFEAKTKVCYVNVDTSEFKRVDEARKSIRVHHNIPEDAVVIVYSARLVEQKQPKVMAHVLKRLKDLGIDFYALVVGNGPLKPWVDSFVENNGLKERVKLLGAISSTSMPSILSAGDIMFLPSEWEGIALAIYEAMSSGLAIVGADVGGQRELFKSRRISDFGHLIPPHIDTEKSIQLYTEVFADLIPRKQTIHMMGKNARDVIVKYFDMKLMGECMVRNMCLANQYKLHRGNTPLTLTGSVVEEITHRATEFIKIQQKK